MTSENRIDMKFIDGVYANGLVVLGTDDGKIIYGRERLTFQDYPRRLLAINRINNCDDIVVIAGKNQIVILHDTDNKIEYTQVTANYNFINAYVYDSKLITYSDDGYLNIYFVDENYNVDKNSLYRINIRKVMSMCAVNNMYIDHSKNNLDIYFLCDNGMVAVIPDFIYSRKTIDEIGNNLLMYAAKLTDTSYFKDMIKYIDTYIIVGYGEELQSCLKVKDIKNLIIQHNTLSSISGPERYMYNFASIYESKYEGSISQLGAIIEKNISVYQDDKGYYIDKKDTVIEDYESEVIDVEDAIKLPPVWENDKIYVNTTDETKVRLNVLVNSEV
jgi:ribosomal protein L30E